MGPRRFFCVRKPLDPTIHFLLVAKVVRTKDILETRFFSGDVEAIHDGEEGRRHQPVGKGAFEESQANE